MSYFLGFILGVVITILFFLCNRSLIKVDYSIEAKKNNKINIPGEFAIYKRKNIFSKWKEIETYADIDWAISNARKRKDLPKYY